MVTVRLLGGMVRAAADGAETIETDAKNIRELFTHIGKQYPELKQMAETRQLSVSIDGNIFRDNWQEPIPQNAEVSVLPRIAGG